MFDTKRFHRIRHYGLLIATTWSAFTAATALSSMPRASWAVPPCCANAPVENVRAAAEIAPIMRLRSMDFLPSVFQENNKERKHCTRTDRAESEQNCSLQLAAFIFRRIHLKEANSHNAGGGSTIFPSVTRR